jgi:hypothetical protein
MPSLSLGLGLHKNRVLTSGGGGAAPIPQSGLSLWLKADAGVTTDQAEYVSRIIFSGATSSILNATFDASSTPDPNNYNRYDLAANNGNSISFSEDDTPHYNLRYGSTNIIILNSGDAINWSLVYNMPTTITISGITGTHISANRTYNFSSYDNDNDVFFFYPSASDYFISTGDGYGGDSTNWFLYGNNNGDPVVISTGPLKNSAPSGSWTNNLSSGSPASTYTGVADGTLPTGTTTISKYGDLTATNWADQSANGYNFISPNNPVYYRPSFINGKPSIDFVTSSAAYFLLDQSIGTIKTIFCVYKTTSTPINYQALVEANLGLYSAIANNEFGTYLATEIGYATLTQNIPYILMVESNDGINSNGYVNGTAYSNSSGNGFGSIDYVQIGTGQYGDQPCNGYISEVIIYNRVLTTTERQKVEAYLNAKYAIY